MSIFFQNCFQSQEEISTTDLSLEDSENSEGQTLPTALPYKRTNQSENQEQENSGNIEYQYPSTSDTSKYPVKDNSDSDSDTIEIREAYTPR